MTLLADPPFTGDGVRGIVFGNGTLFVTQGSVIYEVDPSAGQFTPLTDPEFHDLRGITYDAGAVYVIDNFGESGRILRVDVAEPSTGLLLAGGTIVLGASGIGIGHRMISG